MIAIESLAVTLGGRPVLRDISLTIAAGEFWLLIGANGSGKSTLLRSASGLLPAGHGQVRLLGRPLCQWSRREIARHIAWVAQGDDTVLPLRVADLLMAGRYPHLGPLASPGPADYRRCRLAAERFGLLAVWERDVATLSGGERRKAFLASAWVQDAGWLLLDEPLGALDPPGSRQLLTMLSELAGEKRAVVAATHRLDLFAPLATHAAALKAGRLVFAGPIASLAKHLDEVYAMPEQPA
jgi:iron complex transport system ATP-binding protein